MEAMLMFISLHSVEQAQVHAETKVMETTVSRSTTAKSHKTQCKQAKEIIPGAQRGTKVLQ